MGRRVHQPPVQFAHGLEERVALGPPVHLSGIGVHAQRTLSRTLECRHADAIPFAGQLQGEQFQRIRNLPADSGDQFGRRQRSVPFRVRDLVKFGIEAFRYVPLENEGCPREADNRDYQPDGDREPEMYFPKYLVHGARRNVYFCFNRLTPLIDSVSTSIPRLATPSLPMV